MEAGPAGPPEPASLKWIQAIGGFTAIVAAVAGLLYAVGALVVVLRLWFANLPPFSVVPQLPRELVLGVGAVVLLPAVAAAGAVLLARRLKWTRGALPDKRAQFRWVTLAEPSALAATALALGVVTVWVGFEQGAVCVDGNFSKAGPLLGQTSERVYIGQPKSDIDEPQGNDEDNDESLRIASIPQDRVDFVVYGGVGTVEDCERGRVEEPADKPDQSDVPTK